MLSVEGKRVKIVCSRILFVVAPTRPGDRIDWLVAL